jgi:hypothetical protein
MDKLTITAMWDMEAKVWVAESEQLGIATEAESLDALVAKLPAMIQDLREQPDLVPFEIVVQMGVDLQFTIQTERTMPWLRGGRGY